MSEIPLDLAVGIVSGFLGLLVLQTWPPRHHFSKHVSLTTGTPSGRPIHQVKLGRRRYLVWRKRQGPVDVQFRARVAVKGVGPNPGSEKIVAIPVDKEWRPQIAQSVTVKLLPEHCAARDLRHLPDDIKRKRADGTLRLEDLLDVGDGTTLRLYVFAHRPKTGVRWVRRGKYTLADIRAGVFDADLKVEEPPDGQPPEREDLLEPWQIDELETQDDASSLVDLRIGRLRLLVERDRR